MDERKALRLLRKKYRHKKSQIAHKRFVELYMGGEIKWAEYERECGIFYRTAKRWYDFLEKERENEETSNFAPQLISEADIKAPDLTKAPDGKRLISGTDYISMCEEGMISANSDGRVRDFKLYSDLRSSVVDIAAEMPATHLDIERTLGREGLLGMDEVLAKTIARLAEYHTDFPKTWTTLCRMFGRENQAAETPAKEKSQNPNTHNLTTSSEQEQPALENDSQDAD